MGLNTKVVKQIDNYHEVVSINKSLSQQNIYLKNLFLVVFIFNVYMIIGRSIQSVHNPIFFFFFWTIF